MIIDFSPLKGIVFGGTTVTIRGEHIDFKGQDRYNISFCDEDFCIKCRYSNMCCCQHYALYTSYLVYVYFY